LLQVICLSWLSFARILYIRSHNLRYFACWLLCGVKRSLAQHFAYRMRHMSSRSHKKPRIAVRKRRIILRWFCLGINVNAVWHVPCSRKFCHALREFRSPEPSITGGRTSLAQL
jgi:hypothetical protein